jgi:hypothetical protein
MCRNIKILRAPYAVGVTDDDVHAAALQYVRTVGGVRVPSPQNEEAFNQALDAISTVTRDLLAHLEASSQAPSPQPPSGLPALRRASWRVCPARAVPWSLRARSASSRAA